MQASGSFVARVLIVDDEDAIRDSLRMILEHDGYEVDEASGGGQALAKIARQVPDAILLDLYEGPPPGDPGNHPQFGRRALASAHRALPSGGVFGVWSEDPDEGFERALARAGFRITRERPGRGGRRHVVYLARSPG